MKQKIKEHIEQLDIKKGGGIVSEKIRVGTIDNPMLVIGLGGTGIDALLRLKYMINRRFELPKDNQTRRYGAKPDGIEFIGIETNYQDKDKRYPESGGVGLDPETELLLLSNSNIGPMIRQRELIEPCIKEWLSPDLKPANGTNGAGGIRQLGRLMLFARLDNVIQSIERKINTLMRGNEQRLMVFILSGLSGGTGSGCFLDIPYIIRGIMERNFSHTAIAKVEILGYLFTPDVNLSRDNITQFERDYIMKNGYAALKELDYWMNIGERGERFTQNYRNLLEVNSEMPPFDLCHLVSAHNIKQVALTDAYDYCMNVTAENITNFMANEEKVSGQEFAIQDYLSNVGTIVSTMKKPHQANYKYSVLGASSAVLPIEEITTYLAYKLFQKMSAVYDKAPSQSEVDEFVKGLRLDKDSISRRFDKDVPEPLKGFEQNPALFNYGNVIMSDAAGVMSSLNTYLQKAEEKYISVSSQLPLEAANSLRSKAEGVFVEPEKGPFYVQRMLFSTKGFDVLKSIKAMIEAVDLELDKIGAKIAEFERTSIIKFNEARDAFFINKDRKKNEYIAARIREYKLKAYAKKLDYMKEFYTGLLPLVLKYNNDIFYVFTEILDRLNKIFEDNGSILTNSHKEESGNSTTYYWNIISVPDISKAIDKIVDERKIEELIRDFYQEMLKESKHWLDETDLDIIDSISDFLSDKFDKIISSSMEDFLRIKYGEEMNVREIAGKIAADLNRKAVPVFYMENVSNPVNCPSWGVVSMPLKSPDIKSGIINYQENAIGSPNFTIKESKVANRIFWLNTLNGVPLYTYSPLKIYEDAYEKGLSTTGHVGRHLVQNKENDWIVFPSPIPQDSWGKAYCNQRVQKLNEETRALFARAIQEIPKCIVVDEDNSNPYSKYQCIETEAFNLDDFMANYKINLQDEKNIRFDELKKCIAALTSMLEKGLKETERHYIFNSSDEKAAQDNLIRTPRLISLIKSELAKYDAIRGKLAELEAVINKVKKSQEEFDNFFKVIFTNTICRKGFKYVYDMDESEKGEWQPFADVMDRSKYVEYDIFKNYSALDEKSKKTLVEKSKKRFNKMTDDVQLTSDRIMELVPVYKEKTEQLAENQGHSMETDSMLEFYKKMSDELQEMIEMANL